MALFGRPSAADVRRAERVREWAQARSPYALASVLPGVLAMVDFCTPLAWGLGPGAVVLGVMGIRDVKRRPEKLGGRLAMLGAAMGATGFVLSVTLWAILHSRG